MTTIDQRLLVPVAQSVVWEYISNLNNNPSWQADCADLSFLSSMHEGQGTRWRYSTKKGGDCVVEITAWYNGLGYEYVYIDGPRYRNNRGRIRLQEIAEGTIVQWTFTYEMGGALSGLRNNRRQIENTMATSLKTLYRQVKAYATDDGFDAKSLVRDAPDVEARAQYKPRHPTAVAKSSADTETAFRPPSTPVVFDEPPVDDGDAQELQIMAIDEPPVANDDTRPRPAITSSDAQVVASDVPPDVEGEPEFLADLSAFEPPRRDHDTQPRADVGASAVMAEATPNEAAQEPSTSSELPEAVEVASAAPTEPDTPAEADAGLTDAVAESPAAPELTPTIDSSNLETGKSIWEIFGVERPAGVIETSNATETGEHVVNSSDSAPNESRQGLRIRLRRSLVHLRRPQ